MKQIYIISGLGVDERVFTNIDFSGYEPIYIDWIIPRKNETIQSYAGRLTGQITTENPVIIGLSFGGMMAIEVAKLIKVDKIILIASAKTKYEIPFYYRLAGRIKLQRLLPLQLLKHANSITYWFLGTESREERLLVKNILKDTNADYLKWAIIKVATWQNETYPVNLVHIHGTNDRILPMRFVKCDIKVQGGGHLMTVNRTAELSKLLRECLS